MALVIDQFSAPRFEISSGFSREIKIKQNSFAHLIPKPSLKKGLTKLKAKANKNYKLIFYKVTLVFTIILSQIFPNQWAWWNKIDDHPLYLGALPLHNSHHAKKLKEHNIGAVLSVVEPFELEHGAIIYPETPAEWKKRGVDQLEIPAVDDKILTTEQLDSGIAFINEKMQEGKIIYVHCKAGRGRSASFVLAWIMLHKKYDLNEGLAYLKKFRQQAQPNYQQLSGIDAYVKARLSQ